MNHCPRCQLGVKGDWEECPLCGTSLEIGKGRVPSPYPDVPLKYNRQKGTKIMLLASLAIIFVTFLVGLIWRGRIQTLQAALFGIMTMWLAALIIVRKRRNLTKSILYLLISLSLICVYFDYLDGWTGWSTTLAVPIICGASLVAMVLTVRFVKMKPGDYVLYVLASSLLGLIPALFLVLDWVQNPIPAWISIGLSAAILLTVLIRRWREIRDELQKRLFI